MDMISNEQSSSFSDDGGGGMYYYNRPINSYLFISAFALSMIVILASDGEFTWMGLGVSILWGLFILGGGNLLWAFVGDMLHPYIHRNRYLYEEEYVEDEPSQPLQVSQPSRNGEINTPFQNSGDEFERVINKVVNNGALWAKGMTKLDPEEESQLRQYFKQRWTGHGNITTLPSWMMPSLVKKLQERGLASETELTTRGERIIPWGHTYQRVDGEPIM
jgi:hypothetical protein